MHWLAIALGGALGAIGRYSIVAHLFPVTPSRFPFGTLSVNILGSFLMGICYVLIVEKALVSEYWRFLLMTGFLGAFTTYSAFSLEAIQLWQFGHAATAILYSLLSLFGCLAAVLISIFITHRIV
ncbi:fluoride efflux transporter CrcB [Aurantivibrio infirmus]